MDSDLIAVFHPCSPIHRTEPTASDMIADRLIAAIDRQLLQRQQKSGNVTRQDDIKPCRGAPAAVGETDQVQSAQCISSGGSSDATESRRLPALEQTRADVLLKPDASRDAATPLMETQASSMHSAGDPASSVCSGTDIDMVIDSAGTSSAPQSNCSGRYKSPLILFEKGGGEDTVQQVSSPQTQVASSGVEHDHILKLLIENWAIVSNGNALHSVGGPEGPTTCGGKAGCQEEVEGQCDRGKFVARRDHSASRASSCLVMDIGPSHYFHVASGDCDISGGFEDIHTGTQQQRMESPRPGQLVSFVTGSPIRVKVGEEGKFVRLMNAFIGQYTGLMAIAGGSSSSRVNPDLPSLAITMMWGELGPKTFLKKVCGGLPRVGGQTAQSHQLTMRLRHPTDDEIWRYKWSPSITFPVDPYVSEAEADIVAILTGRSEVITQSSVRDIHAEASYHDMPRRRFFERAFGITGQRRAHPFVPPHIRTSPVTRAKRETGGEQVSADSCRSAESVKDSPLILVSAPNAESVKMEEGRSRAEPSRTTPTQASSRASDDPAACGEEPRCITRSGRRRTMRASESGLHEDDSGGEKAHGRQGPDGETRYSFEEEKRLISRLTEVNGLFTLKTVEYQRTIRSMVIPHMSGRADRNSPIKETGALPTIELSASEKDLLAELGAPDFEGWNDDVELRMEPVVLSIVNKLLVVLLYRHASCFYQQSARKQVADHVCVMVAGERVSVRTREKINRYVHMVTENRVRNFRDAIARYHRRAPDDMR